MAFLVTGATGFVGSWCVKTLLDNGVRVRGTVRDPSAPKCNFLRELEGSERLELVKADLLDSDQEWRSVVRGCRVVLHTASPFVVEGVPAGKEEEYFMEPALQGTENVLKACIAEKIKRVVLTSSIASIQSGHDPNDDPKASPPGFDESVWTNVEGLNMPADMYTKSKTLAERKAWELVEGTPVQLAVINPGLVMGPFLSIDTASGSLTVLKALLTKEYPAVPDLPFLLVDVRDVAKMHYNAALEPTAPGKRFIAVSTSESVSMQQMALDLDEAGFAVPTGKMPNWIMKGVSWFDPRVAMILPSLGATNYCNAINGNTLIGGCWIDYRSSITEQAKTMVDLGGIGHRKISGGICAAPDAESAESVSGSENS